MYIIWPQLYLQWGFNCLTSSHSTINVSADKHTESSSSSNVQLTTVPFFYMKHDYGENGIIPYYLSTSGNQLSCHWQQHGHVAVLAHSGKAPLWKDPIQHSQRRLGLEMIRSSLWTSPLLLGRLPHMQYAQGFVLTRNSTTVHIMSVISKMCLPVCLRYLRLISSTGKKPTVAPYSGHMLEMVALSAMDSCVTPGP